MVQQTKPTPRYLCMQESPILQRGMSRKRQTLSHSQLQCLSRRRAQRASNEQISKCEGWARRAKQPRQYLLHGFELAVPQQYLRANSLFPRATI